MSSQVLYDVDPVFGCHLWTGKVSSTSGRPIIWRGRSPVNAYVVVYELEVGTIPPGYVIEHSCRRPMCVNPLHLEAVTKQQNERLKSMRYRLARRTCARGHALDETTRVLTPEGGVLCRRCATQGWGPRHVGAGSPR